MFTFTTSLSREQLINTLYTLVWDAAAYESKQSEPEEGHLHLGRKLLEEIKQSHTVNETPPNLQISEHSTVDWSTRYSLQDIARMLQESKAAAESRQRIFGPMAIMDYPDTLICPKAMKDPADTFYDDEHAEERPIERYNPPHNE